VGKKREVGETTMISQRSKNMAQEDKITKIYQLYLPILKHNAGYLTIHCLSG
jgi:hypothetical protein